MHAALLVDSAAATAFKQHESFELTEGSSRHRTEILMPERFATVEEFVDAQLPARRAAVVALRDLVDRGRTRARRRGEVELAELHAGRRRQAHHQRCRQRAGAAHPALRVPSGWKTKAQRRALTETRPGCSPGTPIFAHSRDADRHSIERRWLWRAARSDDGSDSPMARGAVARSIRPSLAPDRSLR